MRCKHCLRHRGRIASTPQNTERMSCTSPTPSVTTRREAALPVRAHRHDRGGGASHANCSRWSCPVRHPDPRVWCRRAKRACCNGSSRRRLLTPRLCNARPRRLRGTHRGRVFIRWASAVRREANVVLPDIFADMLMSQPARGDAVCASISAHTAAALFPFFVSRQWLYSSVAALLKRRQRSADLSPL